MSKLNLKLSKENLKRALFNPREIKIQNPLNTFAFYSIEVNWFSKHTKDNSNIVRNPEKFKSKIEELKSFEFSWIVIYQKQKIKTHEKEFN